MAENLVSTDCDDDKTYQRTLAGEIETALAPIEAFKEILLDSDGDGPVKLADIGVVVEALTPFAKRRLSEVDEKIRRDIGRIEISLAKYGHPKEEVGAILAAAVEEVPHA